MDYPEKYIEDKKFIKWVFKPNDKIEKFYQQYMEEHPEERSKLLKLKEDLRKLAFTNKDYVPGTPDKIYRKILVDIIGMEKRNKWRNRFVSSLKYAAVAMLLVAGSFMVYLFGFQPRGLYKFSEELLLIGTVGEPRLYLADGSSITVNGPDYFVDYSNKNMIVVGNDTINNSLFNKSNKHDLLVVAYGKRVKVCLPDKSIVWVNSGSRLIFPEKFEKKKREVYLFGEGYFEVAKSKVVPFYVQTISMDVKVLGTKFNVSAYPEDDKIETVLKEGSVQIESKDSKWFPEKTILKPEQKAIFDKNTNNVKVEEVVPEHYTLWKEGLITVEDETLQGVIKKVERYFNIDIEIQNEKKKDIKISGKLDYNAGRDKVFKYIEKLTSGKFEENGQGKYIFK